MKTIMTATSAKAESIILELILSNEFKILCHYHSMKIQIILVERACQ